MGQMKTGGRSKVEIDHNERSIYLIYSSRIKFSCQTLLYVVN